MRWILGVVSRRAGGARAGAGAETGRWEGREGRELCHSGLGLSCMDMW